MSLAPGRCVQTSHRFDAVSGWCQYGCGWRSDGARESGISPRVPTVLDAPDITEPRRSPHTLSTHDSDSPVIPGLNRTTLPGEGREGI